MHTEPAVLSVYSYAKALKTAHNALCQGASGVCAALEQLSNEDFLGYLKSLDFTFTANERIPSFMTGPGEATQVTFDQNGDLLNVAFDVYNYKLDQSTGFDFVKVSQQLVGLVKYLPARLSHFLLTNV